MKYHNLPFEAELETIATELAAASDATVTFQNTERVRALRRALAHIDEVLLGSRNPNKQFLYDLRDVVAAMLSEDTHPAISRYISQTLKML